MSVMYSNRDALAVAVLLLKQPSQKFRTIRSIRTVAFRYDIEQITGLR
jgi:hypothetical protein